MACKGCKGKGASPFCAWCFSCPVKKKRLTSAEYQKLAEDKMRETIRRVRVAYQERQLIKMADNMDKANIDTSGVEFLLENNI